MNVAFETLGCKLNFAESSTISRDFINAGYEIVSPSQSADVYVINTCTVTEHADKKCRNFIRRVHKLSPDAIIAVIGCYAQLKPQEISAIEGVDIVAGASEKGNLFKLVEAKISARSEVSLYSCDIKTVENVFPAYSSGERTRSFLKVQDGCDYFCTYCTIPLARGKSRNITISELVSQAEEIASKGIKEIVLTGINTGDFGKSTGETFFDLLKALNEVKGIERYRISSIEPNLLKEDIVEWIASGTKFLPHFHIPIQSGCDRILGLMKRRYNTSMFESKINMIRDKMETPQERYTKVFFGIDVIVGFPGETDEDFKATYDFLEKLRPAFLHIFPYSRRANTIADAMPDQVQESVKTARVEALELLCDKLHSSFCEANRGRTLPVLFESKEKNGMMYGYTDNYIRVERPYDNNLIGTISMETL